VLSLAEMDRIAEAEAAGDGSVYVVFQHRHGSGALRAAELFGNGTLGKPQVAVCETLWFRPRSYFDPDWRGNWAGEGGGPTLGHGIHQFDLLFHLIGPWQTLNAAAVRLDRPVEFEDVSLATVIFENGAVGSVINSLLSPKELSRIRIDSEGGTLEVDHVYGYSDADWWFHPAPGADQASRLGRDPGVRDSSGELTDDAGEHQVSDPWQASAGDDRPSNHGAQITRLVDALLAGEQHETTLASTRPTMEFVTALYASAITGGPIDRADLKPGHQFYDALHGHVEQSEITEAFTIQQRR
jgi:predicted dehydrogenase